MASLSRRLRKAAMSGRASAIDALTAGRSSERVGLCLTFHTSRHPQGAGILHVAGDDLAAAARHVRRALGDNSRQPDPRAACGDGLPDQSARGKDGGAKEG